MANVAFGALPPHRKVIVVLEMTLLELAGSRLPKFKELADVIKWQLLFDKTVAVTETVLFPASETAAVAKTTAAVMNRCMMIFTLLPIPARTSVRS